MRQKADDWTYIELDADHVPDGVGHEPIAPDSGYVTVKVRSLRILDVRRGLKRFYGAVHSWTSVAHLRDSRATFQSVTVPAELENIDRKRCDRVISMEHSILGPVPYRGGDLELELGLFSVASDNLAGPFLRVLEGMSKAAGVTFMPAALPFVGPLTQGIELLTGSAAGAMLEIGLAKAWEPTTGYYVIMRAPRGRFQAQDVRFAQDQRLVDASGNAIRDYPYVVFSIEAARERPNFFEIPDLKLAFDALNNEVRAGKLSAAEDAFAVFRRTALTSADLLFDDAQAIVRRADAQVKEVLAGIQTATHAPLSLPELRDLSPFV